MYLFLLWKVLNWKAYLKNQLYFIVFSLSEYFHPSLRVRGPPITREIFARIFQMRTFWRQITRFEGLRGWRQITRLEADYAVGGRVKEEVYGQRRIWFILYEAPYNSECKTGGFNQATDEYRDSIDDHDNFIEDLKNNKFQYYTKICVVMFGIYVWNFMMC